MTRATDRSRGHAVSGGTLPRLHPVADHALPRGRHRPAAASEWGRQLSAATSVTSARCLVTTGGLGFLIELFGLVAVMIGLIPAASVRVSENRAPGSSGVRSRIRGGVGGYRAGCRRFAQMA
jgi:hypothetical protein